MRVLVACECSGKVRQAFQEYGHDALSCDLLPADDGGIHYQGDVFDVIDEGWDLMIAHPPCTHLAVSGNRWYSTSEAREESLEFVLKLMECSIPKWAIENPVSVISSRLRAPDQVIQPWMFGHGETKATCFWLKGLPLLKVTNLVSGREQRIHRMPQSANRQKKRSETYDGIASAMAVQWSDIQPRLDEYKMQIRL